MVFRPLQSLLFSLCYTCVAQSNNLGAEVSSLVLVRSFCFEFGEVPLSVTLLCCSDRAPVSNMLKKVMPRETNFSLAAVMSREVAQLAVFRHIYPYP